METLNEINPLEWIQDTEIQEITSQEETYTAYDDRDNI